MRATGRSLFVACAAVVAAAGVPGVAAAKVRSATDHLSGVRFTLNGRALTLRLVPQAGRKPPDVRAKLYGHRLRASCGHNGPAGTPVAAGLTFIPFRWPRGTLTRKVHLSRDVSASPGWCIVEAVGDGGDIAAVDFKLGHNPVE
ncbi:MAG: hypothetical protein QOD69_3233 [Solirubrobacteraceae bacterium]|nr:hypothetical protein [Solirubrobacteraceae bacterium]